MQQAVVEGSIVSAPDPAPKAELQQSAGIDDAEAAARVGEEVARCLPPASGQAMATSCALSALELDSSSYSQQEFHVLLVDDDLVTLRAVEQLLRRTGYKVTTATSGRDAIKHLVANRSGAYGTPIDLVLTDILMPEVSGFDLMHEVMHGTMFSEVPVVVMSGVDSQESVLKAFEAGAADYLIKPLRRNEVATLWQHVWRANRYKATLHSAGVIHTGLPLDNNHTVNQASGQQAGCTPHGAGSVAAAGGTGAGASGHPSGGTNGTKNGSSGASTSIADQSTMVTSCTHITSAFAAKQGNGVAGNNTDQLQGSGQSNIGTHTNYTMAGVDASHTGPTSLACRDTLQQDWDASAGLGKDGGASGTATEPYNRHTSRLGVSHTSRLAAGAATDTCTDAGTSTSMEGDEEGEGRATSPMTMAPTKLQTSQQQTASGSQLEVQQEQQPANCKQATAAAGGQAPTGSAGVTAHVGNSNVPAVSAQAGHVLSGEGGGSGSIFSAAGRAAQHFGDSHHHSPHSVISANDHVQPAATTAVKSENGTATLPSCGQGTHYVATNRAVANGTNAPSIARPTACRSSSLLTNGSSEAATVPAAQLGTFNHLPRALKELAALGHQKQLEREAASSQHAEHKAAPARAAPGSKLQPPQQPAPSEMDDEQQQQQLLPQALRDDAHRRWQTEEDAEAAEAAGLLLGVAAAAAAEQEAARWAAEHQHNGAVKPRNGLRSAGSSFARANNHGHSHSNKRLHQSENSAMSALAALPPPNTREAAAAIAAANAAASMALSALTVILPRSASANNNRTAGSPRGSGAGRSPSTAVTTDTSKRSLAFANDGMFTAAARSQSDAMNQATGTDLGISPLDPSKAIVSLPSTTAGTPSAGNSAGSRPPAGVGIGLDASRPVLPPPEPLVLDRGETDTSAPATGVPAGPHPIYLHAPPHPQLLLPQSVVPLLAYSFAGMHPELAPHMFMGAARSAGAADGPASAMECAPPHALPPVPPGMPGGYPSVVLVAGRSEAASIAAAHRRAAVQKYLQKKKNRNFKKKVRYESRKRLAEARPRVRGQFVKQETLAASLQQAATSAGGSAGVNGTPRPGTQGSPSQVQAGMTTTSAGVANGTHARGRRGHASGTAQGDVQQQQQQQQRGRAPKRHRADDDDEEDEEDEEGLGQSGEEDDLEAEDSDE